MGAAGEEREKYPGMTVQFADSSGDLLFPLWSYHEGNGLEFNGVEQDNPLIAGFTKLRSELVGCRGDWTLLLCLSAAF